MHLALVANADKPSTLRVIGRILAVVRDGGHHATLWAPGAAALRRRQDYAGELEGIPESLDLRGADVVLALGGDGTLLHAVRVLQGEDRPLLGINLGALGFLTDTPQEFAEETVRRLLAGDYRLESRMLLEVRFQRGAGAGQRYVGFNDAVLHGPRARVLDLSVRVAGVDLGRTLADGVIVATPSGSTAYSLSAGGPVVSPRMRALVVTPISAHTLSLRPLVVSDDEEIEIHLHRSASERAELTVDGHTSLDVAVGERFVVRRAPRDLRLVVTRDRTFYDTLRTKLGWGHRGRAG